LAACSVSNAGSPIRRLTTSTEASAPSVAPAQSPNATAPTTPTVVPAQSPNATAPTTPTVVPAQSPNATAPTTPTLSTPSPATSTGPWSAASCAWALQTVTLDQTLDGNEAKAIAAGTSSGSESTYQLAAARWTEDLSWITPLCASGTAPSYNQAVDMIVWDNWAMSSHLGNTSTPANNAWDGTWAANYEFLNGLTYQLEAAYGWPPTDA